MSSSSSDNGYSSFGEAGSSSSRDNNYAQLSSTSSSSSSIERYKVWFVRYKKPITIVSALLLLALIVLVIVAIVAGRRESNSPPPPPVDLFSSSSSTGAPGPGPPPTPSGKLFTFASAFNSSLTLSYTSLSWSPFDSSYVTTRNRDVIQGFPGGEERTLIPASIIPANLTLYSFSSDYHYFLFRAGFSSLYRHSGQATYYYADRTQSPLTFTPLSAATLQYALFSPSTASPGIAYVQSNNVYYLDLTSRTTSQLTTSGEYNRVIHGVCDWAYEEEVYGRSGVIWFSPSGRYMAFLSFNETLVPEFSFPLYDVLDSGSQYRYKYPKVNATNSVVSVGLVNVATGSTVDIDVGGRETDQYVINVQWIGEETVGVKVMPRVQSSWVLYGISASSPLGARTTLSAQTHPFYLEADFTLQYIPQLGGYLDTVIVHDHSHIALWDEQGRLSRYITQAHNWGVEAVHCYDPTLSTLYVTASYPSSIERTLLAVDVNTGNWSAVIPTSSPTWQAASFSGNCSYFTISEQANPAYLDTRLYRANPSLQLISTLSDNKAKLDLISSYTLPTQHRLTFPSASAPQYDLNAFFLLPPTFTGNLSARDCSYRYPVLINVYGGPGNQLVSARYGLGGNAGLGFATYLSGSKGYVSLVFDPVGTGGKGDSFRKNYTTGRLWQQEEVDVKAVIASLGQFCFIDTDRIAYWGWSYGGSMATRVATSPLSGKVNTVIAVAPVTDWRLYDSIYTERYMRRPFDNPDGYASTSLLTGRARQLQVASYFLIHGQTSRATHTLSLSQHAPQLHCVSNHSIIRARTAIPDCLLLCFLLPVPHVSVSGTADDNVHWQNSALLIEQLTRYQQQFTQFHYTNANHGMNGAFGYTQSNTQHLYRMIYQHLSGMVYGRGGDPAGVVVGEGEGESEGGEEVMAMDWDAVETRAMLKERFFQA